jgi:hypothetical protein
MTKKLQKEKLGKSILERKLERKNKKKSLKNNPPMRPLPPWLLCSPHIYIKAETFN